MYGTINVKSQKNNSLSVLLNGIFVDEIKVNFTSIKIINQCENYEQLDGTLIDTFKSHVGVEILFVWFGYGSQTIFSHTRGQVSG